MTTRPPPTNLTEATADYERADRQWVSGFWEAKTARVAMLNAIPNFTPGSRELIELDQACAAAGLQGGITGLLTEAMTLQKWPPFLSRPWATDHGRLDVWTIGLGNTGDHALKLRAWCLEYAGALIDPNAKQTDARMNWW